MISNNAQNRDERRKRQLFTSAFLSYAVYFPRALDNKPHPFSSWFSPHIAFIQNIVPRSSFDMLRWLHVSHLLQYRSQFRLTSSQFHVGRAQFVVAEDLDTVYVAYAGTRRPMPRHIRQPYDVEKRWRKFRDFFYDLCVVSLILPRKIMRKCDLRVHGGFLRRSYSFDPTPFALWKRCTKVRKDLVFCGHSMGGSVASVQCARLWCKEKYQTKELSPHNTLSLDGDSTPTFKCITFGEPQTFFSWGKCRHDPSLTDRYSRYIVQGDPFPDVLARLFPFIGYCHFTRPHAVFDSSPVSEDDVSGAIQSHRMASYLNMLRRFLQAAMENPDMASFAPVLWTFSETFLSEIEKRKSLSVTIVPSISKWQHVTGEVIPTIALSASILALSAFLLKQCGSITWRVFQKVAKKKLH